MSNKKNVRTYQRGKTWTYSFETARVAGKRKPITKGGFKTEQEAYNAGLTALANHINGLKTPEPVTISYGDFLDTWLKKDYIAEVKPKSYDTINRLCRNHIIPKIGNIKLTELSRPVIKQFIVDKTKEGYAKSTLIILKAIISKSLNSALNDYQFISENPAREIPLPKEAQKRKAKHRIALIKEQQDGLLTYAKDNINNYVAILIGLHCGLRMGETMGLTWDAIDFDNKTIDINKQLSQTSTALFIDEPKYSSYRVISIDDFLISMLKRLRKIRLEEKMRSVYYPDTLVFPDHRNDKEMKDFDFIFRKADGSVYPRERIHYLLRRYKKIINRDLDYHTLRCTHCTDLIIAGALPKAVQKRMGHKNIQITMDIYTSLTEELDTQVKDIISNKLYAKN